MSVSHLPLWQNIKIYQNINIACPQFNAEMLLMSTLNNSMKIFLFPEVIILKIHYAIPDESCFTCKYH
jgi:hypothetical protein